MVIDSLPFTAAIAIINIVAANDAGKLSVHFHKLELVKLKMHVAHLKINVILLWIDLYWALSLAENV